MYLCVWNNEYTSSISLNKEAVEWNDHVYRSSVYSLQAAAAVHCPHVPQSLHNPQINHQLGRVAVDGATLLHIHHCVFHKVSRLLAGTLAYYIKMHA